MQVQFVEILCRHLSSPFDWLRGLRSRTVVLLEPLAADTLGNYSRTGLGLSGSRTAGGQRTSPLTNLPIG